VPTAAEVHGVVGLGNDVEDLGMLADRMDERVRVELAEPLSEGHLGVGREVLVAKHQHMVLIERGTNRGDRVIAQVASEVDSADFGTEQSGQWRKFHHAER